MTLLTRQPGMDKLHVGINIIGGNGAGDLLDNLSVITAIFQLYRFHLIYLCFLTPPPSPRTSPRPQVREYFLNNGKIISGFILISSQNYLNNCLNYFIIISGFNLNFQQKLCNGV